MCIVAHPDDAQCIHIRGAIVHGRELERPLSICETVQHVADPRFDDSSPYIARIHIEVREGPQRYDSWSARIPSASLKGTCNSDG